MVTTYVLEFENDLNYANVDISNLVFEFYTLDKEEREE
jgi:hypothetical protein